MQPSYKAIIYGSLILDFSLFLILAEVPVYTKFNSTFIYLFNFLLSVRYLLWMVYKWWLL